MQKEYCEELVEFVRSIQPNCLINGRIGYRLGDYRQMSDNSIPVTAYHGDWETPMTLNDTWGYRTGDESWKSTETIQRMLVDIVGKGGNFLLNVGPDGRGVIPEGSAAILRRIGAWLKTNGESIYGADCAPDFPYQMTWGGVTYRDADHTLYLHILRYPPYPHQVLLTGMETRVIRAQLLATGKELPYEQTYETARNEHRLRVTLPKHPYEDLDLVVAVKLAGPCTVQSLYS